MVDAAEVRGADSDGVSTVENVGFLVSSAELGRSVLSSSATFGVEIPGFPNSEKQSFSSHFFFFLF